MSWHGKTYYQPYTDPSGITSINHVHYEFVLPDGSSGYAIDQPVFDVTIPSNCTAFEVTYSYRSDIINKQYQGIKKKYYMLWADTNPNGQVWYNSTVEIAGSQAFNPVIDQQYEYVWLKPNDMEGQTNGFIQYTFTILFY